MTHPSSLPQEYILGERYLLHAVSRYTAGGIVYSAWDKKLRITVEILEYIPSDFAFRTASDTFEISAKPGFDAKLEHLRTDCTRRIHSADSNIYDIVEANGTLYLIHVPEEKSAPSVSDTDALPILPNSSPDDHDNVPASGTANETPLLSVRTLTLILGVGILLLLISAIAFIMTLWGNANLQSDPDSILGIPYSEIDDNLQREWLVVGREQSDSYAPYSVISETLAGDTLHVILNGATPTFIVPDFVGMTAEGAETLLNRTAYTNSAGLVKGQITLTWEEAADIPHGQVIGQVPAAGVLAKSTSITLTLANNPSSLSSGKSAVMESVIGKMYDENLYDHPILITDKIYSIQPAGEILNQYPAPGAQYLSGAPCWVVVSLGPAKTAVPDVQFLSLEEAEEILYACGLSFTVNYIPHENVKEGMVYSQEPVGGTAADYGQKVILTVSGTNGWHTGPEIQTNQNSLAMNVGDIYTMELGEGISAVYHTSAPGVVSVDTSGVITALSSGTAIVTASHEGNTVSVLVSVSYESRHPVPAEAVVGSQLSLDALGDTDSADTVWYFENNIINMEKTGIAGILKAGNTLLWGSSGSQVTAFLFTLQEAEKEPVYISVRKSLASDLTKMKNTLQSLGIPCTVKEDFSSSKAGTVLRIQYTGYSDSENYYFTEGTDVTLIVSKGQPAVRSITVETKPAKLTYTVGESLNTAGLTIRVFYENDSEAVLTQGFTVSYDFSSAGRKTVSVSYEQRKASFAVEVEEAPRIAVRAEIASMPSKTEYQAGESLNTTGLAVKVHYSDGSTQIFENGFATEYSFEKAGICRVNVTIEGVSTYFNVNVTKRTLMSIMVTRAPVKLEYTAGEPLDDSGMVLTAYYSDGSSDLIRSGWTLTGNTDIAGASSVTVIYQGKTTSFAITITEPPIVLLIAEQKPSRLTYAVGDTVDLSGLILSVTRENGKTFRVSWPDQSITWKADLSKAGESTLTVMYEGVSTNIPIAVTDAVPEAIAVLVPPTKTEYQVGDTLDTTGLVLLAVYPGNKTEQITSGYQTEYDFGKAGSVPVVITYRGIKTTFTVTVTSAVKGGITLSATSLHLEVGATAELAIAYTPETAGQLTYTVSSPEILRTANTAAGLLLTGLQPGQTILTFTDGKDTVTCTVTVTETASTTPAPGNVSMPILQQTGIFFMPALRLTGNGSANTVFTFTVTVTFDSQKLTVAEAGALVDGIKVEQTDTAVIISGTVTVPQNESLDTAYIIFAGMDTEAFQFRIS